MREITIMRIDQQQQKQQRQSLLTTKEDDFNKPLLTSDTLLDTPTINILAPINLSATPTPLLNLKHSFYLNPAFAKQYPFVPPSLPPTPPPKDEGHFSYTGTLRFPPVQYEPEPANPYRDSFSTPPASLPPTPKDPISFSDRFAPPRFSNRLRALVQNRPKPLRVYPVPPPTCEKQRLLRHAQGIETALTVGSSAAWVDTPVTEKSMVGRWCERMDPRLWLFVTLIMTLGLIVTGAAVLVNLWGVEGGF